MAISLPLPPPPAKPRSQLPPSSLPFSSSPSISSFISSNSPLLLLETKCQSMTHLQSLHAQIIKTGLAQNPIAISRLLSFCASHDLSYALRLFSLFPNPSSFSYNTLIRAVSRSSSPLLAFSLFLKLLETGPLSLRLTLPSLFSACAHLGLLQIGAQLHAMAAKLGLSSDRHVANAVVFMYGSCGDVLSSLAVFHRLENPLLDVVACNSIMAALLRAAHHDEAQQIFDGMPQRTVFSWNTMMSGYLRLGRPQEVLDMFTRMQKSRVSPNASAIVTLLGACAELGAAEQGKWAHSLVLRHGVEMTPIVLNAVIRMYSACGQLDKALEAFESAPTCTRQALSPWNTIISALGVHGRGSQALDFFSRAMKESGLMPDKVTFVAVLSACAHAGMVEEAKAIFRAMEDEHGVAAGVEHYGAMADVLGRAGELGEAEEMIRRMKMKPDAGVWGALLAASKSYGDLEVAERAAAEVVALDSTDAGGYLLLANARAAKREFEAAARARARMKERRTRQRPGCTMIEVDGVVHEFLAS
ncbi:pentatricopeptide repeat-containing protein At2g42920, chloroplastic-like [Wolffia australiana]